MYVSFYERINEREGASLKSGEAAFWIVNVVFLLIGGVLAEPLFNKIISDATDRWFLIKGVLGVAMVITVGGDFYLKFKTHIFKPKDDEIDKLIGDKNGK
jgi:hypothetical protein